MSAGQSRLQRSVLCAWHPRLRRKQRRPDKHVDGRNFYGNVVDVWTFGVFGRGRGRPVPQHQSCQIAAMLGALALS